MMRLPRLLTCLLLVLAFGVALFSPQAGAESRRERKKREEAAVQTIQTFQAPPVDSLAVYCEPIRQEAVQLAQKPFIVRWAYEPRRLWLIRRHIDCKSRLMDQEYTYLKQVDIQQAPHLPALKVTEPSADSAPSPAQPPALANPEAIPPKESASPSTH